MIEIKQALFADIPVIRTLTQEIWPVTYHPIIGEQQVAYMLDLFYNPEALMLQMEQGQQFILIYDGGIPEGFASYSLLEAGVYKLNKLYVLSGRQGKGLGRKMLQYICDDIRQRGAKYLRLNVNIYNQKAIDFYAKSGFYKIKDEDIDIGQGYYMNDHVFELAL